MTYTTRYRDDWRGRRYVAIHDEHGTRVGQMPVAAFRALAEGDPESFDLRETPDILVFDQQVADMKRLLEEPAIRMVFDRMEEDAAKMAFNPARGITIADIQDAEMQDLMRWRIIVTLRRRCEHMTRWDAAQENGQDGSN